MGSVNSKLGIGHQDSISSGWTVSNVTSGSIGLTNLGLGYHFSAEGDFEMGNGGLVGTIDTFEVGLDGEVLFEGVGFLINAAVFYALISSAGYDPFAGWAEITSKKDIFNGNSEDESMLLGGGRDKAFGKGGKDEIFGESGNDTLFGGGGRDSLYGGADLDSLDGGKGHDFLFGGGGGDIVVGGGGLDELYGGGSRDDLSGGKGSDTLYGGSGRDFLYGGAGDDSLFGGAGKDKMFGGKGNDIFRDLVGTATLAGGSGKDEFDFDADSSGRVVIKDFGKGDDLLAFAELLVGEDLTGRQIYKEYGSKKNGNTVFEFDDVEVDIRNYTTTAAGWGEDILSY